MSKSELKNPPEGATHHRTWADGSDCWMRESPLAVWHRGWWFTYGNDKDVVGLEMLSIAKPLKK